MKNKTKITPQIFQSIKDVVAELPPVATYRAGHPVYKDQTVPGTMVKPEDLKPGTPYDPKLSYKIKVLQYENHEQNLIAGIKAQGVSFLFEYRDAIRSQQAALNRHIKEKNSIKKRISNFFNKINPWKKSN